MVGMIIIIISYNIVYTCIYLVYNYVVQVVIIVVMLAGSGYKETLLRKIQIIVPALNSPDLYTSLQDLSIACLFPPLACNP